MAGMNIGLLIGELQWFSFSNNIINQSNNNLSFYVGQVRNIIYMIIN